MPNAPSNQAFADVLRFPRVLFPGWGMPPAFYAAYGAKPIFDFGFFHGGREGMRHPGQAAPGIPPVDLTVVAHSLGCLAALESGTAAAARRLVLIGGFTRFTAAAGQPGQPPAALRAMRLGLRRNPRKTLADFHAGMDFDAPPELPAELGATALAQGLEYLESRNVRAAAKALTVPTLLLHGAADRIVGLEMAESLAAAIPGARLKVFDNAGHALPFTHQAACLEAIAEFEAEPGE